MTHATAIAHASNPQVAGSLALRLALATLWWDADAMPAPESDAAMSRINAELQCRALLAEWRATI